MTGRYRKLLVVDDDPVDAKFVVRAFSNVSGQLHITHVDDADTATSRLEVERFDYILLDINMPGIDGMELLRRIRSNGPTALTPVIMLTSSMNQNDVFRAYESGANAYAVKPSSITGYKRFAEGFASFWIDVAIAPSRH
ncbi:response regulator [Pararhizobium sp.]|uniref:response regulator n=1 Tax=Pararhizobium sp. TaxID=1977563 RepID=UPI002720E192|nr:response regulator [Pararhizobium sp.]MDO9418863.1 response regulator [Pararhizobium sp.]